MENYDLIRQAILGKRQVIATYNGYNREMCPHVLGEKNGRKQCLFYQFGGQSSSGQIIPGSTQNWRCIPVNQLQNVSVRDGNWHTASNHSIPQTCVDLIDVEIQL